MKKYLCEVKGIEKLNHDVYRVCLVLPETESQSPIFDAGQYLDIVLPDGNQASFSIGSAPEKLGEIELHIRHIEASVMSDAIVKYLLAHDSVEIELPKGNCVLHANQLTPETRLVMVAASTGFAQIKSAVEHLLASGVANPIDIYWGVRVAEDLYLDALPKEWAAEHANVNFVPVVSEPEHSPDWKGRTGLLPSAILEDITTFDDVNIFVSGSPAMVYALLDACEEKGFDEANMQADVFAYAPRPK